MEYLLSVENLKKLGIIHNNTDTKLLAVAIIRSQDMHIQPALGTPLYRKLLDDVKNNTFTQDYIDLMNNYVVPCLVAFVDYRCASLLTFKETNKGVGRLQDDNLQTLDIAQVDTFREQLRKDAYFYKERLIGYLLDDQAVKYPEYCDMCADHCNEFLKKDKTGYTPIGWIQSNSVPSRSLNSKFIY
jgi:hypothetical protein